MPDFYGTAEGFRAYHAARNRVIPDLDDAETESVLLVSSEWLDSRYRPQWPGEKLGVRSQIREWPRLSAYDYHLDLIDGIPVEVDNAVYEAAAIQASTPGALSVNFTPNKYQSVSVDGAVSVTYATILSVQDAQTQFAIIGEILSSILTGGSGNAPYVGTSQRR